MTMMHTNPWAVFGQLLQEVDRKSGGLGDEAAVTADFRPAVDIREYQDAYVLYADLPGVAADDIDIQMESGVLTIRGERKLSHADDEGQQKRSERARGVFFRRFALPETVDADGVRARAEQGVLEIRIPKQARVMPRRISVQTGAANDGTIDQPDSAA